jgi:hypothetical protein
MLTKNRRLTMTALREEIIEYVNLIPEEKLSALKPLLLMLSVEPIAILERLTDNDLTEEEREAFNKADLEFERGEMIDFEDYMKERGIA